MTVSNIKVLKAKFLAAKALGDKAISSDAVMVIDGFEDMALLIKQFPWPVLSPQGEIEIQLPDGSKMFKPQQVNTALQGPIALMETTVGHVSKMLIKLLQTGGTFNAKLYEGGQENPTRVLPILSCFIQADSPDRDWENRAQPLLITGTMFYHYFGDEGDE
jgi:hypothetical protein